MREKRSEDDKVIKLMEMDENEKKNNDNKRIQELGV